MIEGIKYEIIIKDVKGNVFDIGKIINEIIGCLNEIAIDISELQQFKENYFDENLLRIQTYKTPLEAGAIKVKTSKPEKIKFGCVENDEQEIYKTPPEAKEYIEKDIKYRGEDNLTLSQIDKSSMKKEKSIKVKIIKCNDICWYKHRVNEIFEVKGEDRKRVYVDAIIDENGMLRCGIDKSDCETVKEQKDCYICSDFNDNDDYCNVCRRQNYSYFKTIQKPKEQMRNMTKEELKIYEDNLETQYQKTGNNFFENKIVNVNLDDIAIAEVKQENKSKLDELKSILANKHIKYNDLETHVTWEINELIEQAIQELQCQVVDEANEVAKLKIQLKEKEERFAKWYECFRKTHKNY